MRGARGSATHHICCSAAAGQPVWTRSTPQQPQLSDEGAPG